MKIAWWVLLCYMISLPIPLIGEGDYLLAFSFYVNGALIAYMSWKSLVKDSAGPSFATVNIFLLMFFYVAPIAQVLEYRGYLVNFYNAPLDQMLLANIFIFLFTAIFLIIYNRRSRIEHKPFLKVDDAKLQSAFPIYFILAAIMVIWAVRVMLIDAPTIDDSDAALVNDFMVTIRHKVGYVIPFAVLGFYLSTKRQRWSLLLIAILVIFVLLSKNILLDRRNSLGPIYLSLVFLLLWRGKKIGSRSVFLLVGSALLFVFPITAIYINHPINTWGELTNFENISREVQGQYVDTHYDAWANIVATIQFVQTEGLQLGHQILGALLFYFPRSLWADKPVSSGQMLGDYLVLNSGLWFTNISFPFPAEGYVDFGIIGLMLYAVGLAFYSQRMDYFVNSGDAVDRTSALYFSFYLTFVMRGAFLPAFAFGSGAYLAMNLVPWIISKIGARSRHIAVSSALAGLNRSAADRP